MDKELVVSKLEFDYLKANGELLHFDAGNTNHRNLVQDYLSNVGIEVCKEGDDWAYFENKDAGVRAYFSNFPMKNRKIYKKTTLSIEFSGHFFIRKNADLAARKILQFFTKRFGTFFKVSRVDIRQDIYNAKYPFDYFPDFTCSKNKLIWALRGNPEFNQYYDDPTDKATGFTIKTSRYKVMSYNRNISLEKKFKQKKITYEYFNHYMRQHEGRDVQRLEVSLKKDACKVFSLLFFNTDYHKDTVLTLTMANFARNHALKHDDPSRPIHKMKVNKVFADLFFYEEKEKVKVFKRSFVQYTNLSISDAKFSETGKSVQEISKMLSKKICEIADGSKEMREEILYYARDLIVSYFKEFKDITDKRRVNFMKTLKFMDFDYDELSSARRIIHSPSYF